MGRPRKPDSEKYRSPVLSLRVPELDVVKAAAAANGETQTEFVLRAIRRELARQRRHAQKESRDSSPDTEETK